MKIFCESLNKKYLDLVKNLNEFKIFVSQRGVGKSRALELKPQLITQLESLKYFKYQYEFRKTIARDCDYSYVGVFHAGVAVAHKKDDMDRWFRFFYINERGQRLLHPELNVMERDDKFQNGVGVVIKDGEDVLFVNKEGDVLFGGTHNQWLREHPGEFNNGFASVKTVNAKGIFYLKQDFETRLIPKSKYYKDGVVSHLRDFHDGLAIVEIALSHTTGREFFIDTNGKQYELPGINNEEISTVNEFHGELAIIATLDGGYMVYDKSRAEAHAPSFIESGAIDDIEDFSDGLAVLRINNDYFDDKFLTSGTYIRPDATQAFGPDSYFYRLKSFSNGLAAVEKDRDSNWYYINTEGKKAFNKEFMDANPFMDGLAWVSDGDNSFYCIDTTGNSAFDDKNFRVDGFIDNFIDGVAQVYIDNVPTFIDRRGRIIFK